MHAEALGGGVAVFDAAIETRACPFLNQLGEAALGEMRDVYQQVEAGNFDAIGELADRLATAVEQNAATRSAQPATEQELPPITLSASATKPKREIRQPEAAKVEEAPAVATIVTAAVAPAIELTVNKAPVAAQAELPKPRVEVVRPPDALVAQVTTAVPLIRFEQPVAIDPIEIRQPIAQVRQDISPAESATAVLPLPVDLLVDEALRNTRQSVEAEEPTRPLVQAAESLVASHEEVASPPLDTSNLLPLVALPSSNEAPSDITKEEFELLLYEAEVVETYRELLAITETQESATEPSLELPAIVPIETSSLVVDETDDSPAHVDAESVYGVPAIPDIQKFLEEQPQPQERVTLATIQEHAAEEQSLEQTFAQVAVLLSEPAPAKTEEQVDLAVVLRDIVAVMPECYVVDEAGTPNVRVTPEVTRQLIVLLGNLGYEQPRQVLVKFVEDYGLDFLLQTVQHIYQLTGKEADNPEFATQTSFFGTAVADDEYSRVRLGRALFELITRAPHEAYTFRPVALASAQ